MYGTIARSVGRLSQLPRTLRSPVSSVALLALVTSALGLAGCDGAVLEPAGGASVAEAETNELRSANAHLGALYQLQAAFHGALNAGDKEAVRSLWAPDAQVFAGPIGCTPCTGPDEIADAFATSGPFLNGWASLAPAYKTRFDLQGNTAEYEFECVYLTDVGTGDVLSGPVHAHLNATGTMVLHQGRWVFQTFQAGLGAL